MKTKLPFLLITLPLLLSVACKKAEKSEATSSGDSATAKPIVYTTFYPTQYFTQRIAGDLVEAVCPVPSEEDAIFWEPDAEMIGRYQKADLIVLNGAGFAKWVAQATLPESRVVDTAKPFAAEFITYENAVVHKHGNEGAHSHEGIDGHTWVDPVNAKIQAGVLRDALVRRWPEHKGAFENGFASLAADLDQLDAGFRELAPAAAETPLLASHPAYNYIARRYGWKIHNLDLDPGEMPDDEAFAKIRDILATFPAETLLWESEPTSEIVARVQTELGLASKVFSPCELKDPETTDDFLGVMQGNLKTMREIFAEP